MALIDQMLAFDIGTFENLKFDIGPLEILP